MKRAVNDPGRGHSSAGRASGLQPEGRRFDPGWLHHSPGRPVRAARDDASPSMGRPRLIARSRKTGRRVLKSCAVTRTSSLTIW